LAIEAEPASPLPAGANPQVANPFPLGHDSLAYRYSVVYLG
jgi:hypothetical protein